MEFRRGVQAEVLLSLALVMVAGTALLAAIFLKVNHSRIEALHGVLGRGFSVEAEAEGIRLYPLAGGNRWRIDRDGLVIGLNASAAELDDGTRALADESIALREVLVSSGAPWNPILFAAPSGDGKQVVVGRVDAPVSGAVLAALVLVDVFVFGLFGASLLQRRVVGPLHRLAFAVRVIGEGGLPANVPGEGVGEIEALGNAFNEMQHALAVRTGALEKAVFELRATNERLVQARDGLDRAERLAMVGSLAAGLAHEVGNPMGALLAFLDLAARDPGLGVDGRRYLDRATQQCERVRVILRQLLDFARPPEIQHVAISLEEIVHQVVELVSAQPEFSPIEFEVRVEDGIGPARGDRSIASQILLNLALNAAKAVQDSSTKRIYFEIARAVRRRRSEDEGNRPGVLIRSDSMVCRVGDSGPGVRLADPERIFDPFFTTKAPGEGTGLGLANARRLAQELGGSIDLAPSRSELGGALFELVLPADDGQAARASLVRNESRT